MSGNFGWQSGATRPGLCFEISRRNQFRSLVSAGRVEITSLKPDALSGRPPLVVRKIPDGQGRHAVLIRLFFDGSAPILIYQWVVFFWISSK